MITRFALFDGRGADESIAAFRSAVRKHLMPLPGITDIRVMSGEGRDAGAPEFPLIQAITYPDQAAKGLAPDSPARHHSEEVTGEIVGAFLDGHIYHHVTKRHEFMA